MNIPVDHIVAAGSYGHFLLVKIQTLFWLTYDVEQAGHLGEDQHFVFTRHQPGDSPCVSIFRFEN